MADAGDLKSPAFIGMRVRVPPRSPSLEISVFQTNSKMKGGAQFLDPLISIDAEFFATFDEQLRNLEEHANL
mgnify:CR=1 FL=1